MNNNLDIYFSKIVKGFKVWYPQLKELVVGYIDVSTTLLTVHEVTMLHSELESMSEVELETMAETSNIELETKIHLKSAFRSGTGTEMKLSTSNDQSNSKKQAQDLDKLKSLVISGLSGVGKRTLTVVSSLI